MVEFLSWGGANSSRLGTCRVEVPSVAPMETRPLRAGKPEAGR
jgi:hypothetical protein